MASSGSKKILLVDYEVSKMKATEDFLTQADFDVIKAFDGLDALEKFAEEQPDLVLLSAMLPKLHGFEVCKAIKQSDVGKSIPVLITTSVYKSYKYKRQAMKDYMADDYILKPFNYEELLVKIREHLGIEDSEPVPPPERPRPKAKPATAKPAHEKSSKADEQSFDKLLDETLETLLKTSEMEDIADESKPKKTAAEKDLDSILEDTLSGLLKIPSAQTKRTRDDGDKEKPTAEKKVIPEKEPEKEPEKPIAVEPEEEVISETPPEPSTEPEEVPVESSEIDRIIDEAITIIDDAESQAGQAKETHTEDLKTVQISRKDIESAFAKEKEKEKEKPVISVTPSEEGIQFGKYILIEKIATGGMAEMWKAKQKGPEGFAKLVALKRILPHLIENEDFITMFIDEGKVAAQLTHPNIAQIYELGEQDGSYYIAMEYIAGKDLRSIMRVGRQKGKTLRPELATTIAIKLLAGMHYAHRKKGFNNEDLNIVHRDITPHNVLISYEGQVKLVDFGIAKAAAKNSVTQTGALKGKILYMSPEQAWGQSVDRRSDIFSLGVLFYEMLTSKRVFLADNEIAILQKVREWDPPPPSSAKSTISSQIDRIVLKAIAKNPSQRYQTADEMRRDLESYLAAQKFPRKALDLSLYMRELFTEDIEKEMPELLESAVTYDETPAMVFTEDKPSETPAEPEPSEEVAEAEPVAESNVSEPEPAAEKQAEAVSDELIQIEEEIEDLETVEQPVSTEEIQEIEPEEPEPEPEPEPEMEPEPEPEPEPTTAEPPPPEPPVTSEPKEPEEPEGPEPAVEAEEEVVFDESFLSPSKKSGGINFKNPLVLGGIGIAIVAVILAVLFSSGGKKSGQPPAPPTLSAAAVEATQKAEAALYTPIPEVRATDTFTPEPTATSTPKPVKQVSRIVYTAVPTTTPTPAPSPTSTGTPTMTPQPTSTPLPTKIPAGTFIEHPEVKPTIKKRVPVKLPRAAKLMGVSGNVTLRILVDEHGDVLDIEVLNPSKSMVKSGCVKAAEDAVKQWKFTPATQDGVPVKTHFNMIIPFRTKK